MNEVPMPRPAAKNIRFAFILGGIQVGGALLLTLANKQGLIDHDTVTRGVMVLIGLCVAASGNRMPKTPDGPPPQTLPLAALRHSVLRVGGRTLMLIGLAIAGLWALAPRDVAQAGSIAAGAAMIVFLSYVVWRVVAYHRAAMPKG